MGDVTHVAIPHTTPVFNHFRDGHFFAVFIFHHRPAFAFEVCVPHDDLSAEDWDRLLTFVPIVTDERAAYYSTLQHVASYRPYLTKADRLSIGWADAYGGRIADLQSNLLTTPAASLVAIAREEVVDPTVRDFFRSLLENERRLDWAITWMKRTVGTDGARLIHLLKQAIALDVAEVEQPGTILKEICGAYCWSSDFTDCGHRIAWIDSLEQRVATMDIDPKGFPKAFHEDAYWKRQLWELPYELGRILTGCDVPVEPASLVKNIAKFPKDDDIAAIHQLADDFFADAVANKVWTIPPGAIIEQPFGPFAYIELHEYGQSVFCVFWTNEGEAYTAAVNPENGFCSFAFPLFSQEGQEDQQQEEMEWATKRAVEAGVRLLLAAFIRDFWVVEEREKVFGHRQLSRSPYRRPPNEEDKPRVIYLPRIRYTGRPDTGKASKGMEYPERRQHSVAAHLRRSPSASEHQLILAKRYGFNVPDGCTFVRPHERGKIKREVIYRSRSALQLLYAVSEDATSPGSPRWFQFERDVYHLMAALGFTVEHIAASRHGDKGVDIYATKGTDLDRINWVIQCKCLHPKRHIPPGTIRELEGALNEYPRNQRNDRGDVRFFIWCPRTGGSSGHSFD